MIRLSRSAWLSLLVVVTGGVICLLLFFWSPRVSRQPLVEPVVSVKVMSLVKGTYVPTARLYGVVESMNHSRLRAPTSSDVWQVKVQDGDRVSAGQPLVLLDNKDAQLQLNTALSEVIQQRKQREQLRVQQHSDERLLRHKTYVLEYHTKQMNRINHLFAKHHVSQRKHDQVNSEHHQLAAEVEALKTQVQTFKQRDAIQQQQLQQAENRVKEKQRIVNRQTVVAPFAGRISAVNVAQGERVSAGHELMQIIDDQQLQVRALLPEQYLRQLSEFERQQQVITAQATGQGVLIPLKLVSVLPQVKPGQVGREVLFDVIAHQSQLAVGEVLPLWMYLQPIPQSFVIPTSALYLNNQVYVVLDQRLFPVQVTILGRRFNHQPEQLIVSSRQLRGGDQVLVTQVNDAMAGMKVRTQEVASGR